MEKRTRINTAIIMLVIGALLIGCAKTWVDSDVNEDINYKRVITATDVMQDIKVGWNLGNSLDSYIKGWDGKEHPNQEILWYNPKVTKELIDYVYECGFNTIRIPVTWYYNTYRDEDDQLHIYESWLERVQEVVDYALDNDMYVILNSHHDQEIFYVGTSQENMEQVLEDAVDLWTDIGLYFSDYDERLIFEAFNEVDNEETSDKYSEYASSQMDALNQIFVNTVREIGGGNENRILIIPTIFNRDSSEVLDSFRLPKDIVKNKLIVEVHDYSGLYTQDVELIFERLDRFSDRIGAPVLVGEFGTTSKFSPSDYRCEQAANFVTRAAEHGIKCIWWDNGNMKEYGIIDRDNFEDSDMQMIEALFSGNICEVDNENVIECIQMDEFIWKQLNEKTGMIVDDLWWGSLTTDVKGAGIVMPESSDYMSISVSNSNNAEEYKPHKLCFYDADGNFISTVTDKYYGLSGKNISIPEDARYVRICIYSIYTATKKDTYIELLENNDIRMILSFVDFQSGLNVIHK